VIVDNTDEILRVQKEYDRALELSIELEIRKDPYNNPHDREAERLKIQLEFLKQSVSVKRISNGFIIDDRFHVGYSGDRWRVLGKNKWYLCPKPEKFVKKYVLGESV
jgi:hypothetical protein